jgi:tRNA threonylcarbamoyladenosine biosynthesis protein TsaB
MTEFNCIALETSTSKGSVAGCKGMRSVSKALAASRSSSREIIRAVSEVLTELEMTPADLNCVAYGCGPGSFTGVRVAASAAQGIAFALGLPVCKISSLAAMAAVVINKTDKQKVVSCLDARMGEAYMGAYAIGADGGLQVKMKDKLINPTQFRLLDEYPDAFAVGDGWREWSEMLTGHSFGADTNIWPEAQSVLNLAREKFALGDVVTVYEALPNYIRNNVTS